MMNDAEHRQLIAASPLFTEPCSRLILSSVAFGNCPGRIWCHTPDDPRTAILWNGSYCLFLAGQPDIRSLFCLLTAASKQIRRASPRFFQVSADSPSLGALLPSLLPQFKRDDRILLNLPPKVKLDHVDLQPPYALYRLDSRLLGNGHLEGMERVRQEVLLMWPSLERFLTCGFGFVILHNHKVVSWCTAEYVGSHLCGIGIETHPKFRNQGLARIAATALVREARARNLTPNWDSWKENSSSLAVARRIGFSPLATYQVYSTSSISPSPQA